MGWLEKVSREGKKKNCGKEFHANVLGERFPNRGIHKWTVFRIFKNNAKAVTTGME